MNNYSKKDIKKDNKIENKINNITKGKQKMVNKPNINELNDASKNNLSKPKLVILITSLVLFIILTGLVLTKHTAFLDDWASNFALSIRSDELNDFMVILTNISSAYSLIAISLLLLFILKNKREPFLIILNLTSVFIFSQIVKLIIHRPRPIGDALVEHIGYSYPSGHSMVSLAYFGFIAYKIYKNTKNKTLKYFSLISISVLIVVIGFSRIYLGVHYLSDVLGGFFLAIPYLVIFNYFEEKYIAGDYK